MIDIAEAGDADVLDMGSFIRSLWRAAGPEAPGLTGATDDAIDEISAPDALRARIVGPGRRIFLARRSSEIVGFAALRPLDENATELAGIMVHPDHQGGVGTPLFEAARRAAREDGYRLMRVRTESGNEGALRFYLKQGFAPLRRTVEEVEGTSVDVEELELAL